MIICLNSANKLSFVKRNKEKQTSGLIQLKTTKSNMEIINYAKQTMNRK